MTHPGWIVLAFAWFGACPLSGQQDLRAPADSADLRSRAEDAQAEFERVRVRESPLSWGSAGSSCDERVGRLCLRFGSDGPVDPAWAPPEEPAEVIEAREQLLLTLEEAHARIPGDGWILGQRVVYLGEAGRWNQARELAQRCALPDDGRWWCKALEGAALHRLGEHAAADAAFARVLRTMPPAMRERWADLGPVVERELRDRFRDSSPDSVSRLAGRLWTLGDPLFLVPGRDREAEHYTRHVLARVREDAENPYRMTWSDDLREVLVRYGPETHYERERTDPLRATRPAAIGHTDPRVWQSLPTEEEFLDPGGIRSGSWATDRRTARSYYVPSYAPTIQPLEIQQARFRSGDSLVVVIEWRAEDRWGVEDGSGSSGSAGASSAPIDTRRGGSEGEAASGLEAALFLVPVERLHDAPGTGASSSSAEVKTWVAGAGDTPVVARDTTNVARGTVIARGTAIARGMAVADRGTAVVAGGTAVARVPVGDYLLSLELLDRAGTRAWRARHGVSLQPRPRGVVALSDLLLLEPARAEDGGASTTGFLPADTGEQRDRLDAHLDRILSGRRVEAGLVEVAWEAYGIPPGVSELRFRISAEPAERGLLERMAGFLGLADSDSATEISWSEGLDPDRSGASEGSVFRRVLLDLSPLPSGPVRLSLSLEMPGRTPVTAETVVELVGS